MSNHTLKVNVGDIVTVIYEKITESCVVIALVNDNSLIVKTTINSVFKKFWSKPKKCAERISDLSFKISFDEKYKDAYVWYIGLSDIKSIDGKIKNSTYTKCVYCNKHKNNASK